MICGQEASRIWLEPARTSAFVNEADGTENEWLQIHRNAEGQLNLTLAIGIKKLRLWHCFTGERLSSCIDDYERDFDAVGSQIAGQH